MDRLLLDPADSNGGLARNAGGFIAELFLRKIDSFVDVEGEFEPLLDGCFLVIEENEKEASGCLSLNPPMVFCSKQIALT